MTFDSFKDKSNRSREITTTTFVAYERYAQLYRNLITTIKYIKN